MERTPIQTTVLEKLKAMFTWQFVFGFGAGSLYATLVFVFLNLINR